MNFTVRTAALAIAAGAAALVCAACNSVAPESSDPAALQEDPLPNMAVSAATGWKRLALLMPVATPTAHALVTSESAAAAVAFTFDGAHSTVVVGLERLDASRRVITRTLPTDPEKFFGFSTAVSSDGTVWGGWGTTLVRVNPTTSEVTTRELPDDGLTGSLETPGGGQVAAMALDSSGTIVHVARFYDAQLWNYATSTNSWITAALPPDSVPGDFSRSMVMMDGAPAISGPLVTSSAVQQRIASQQVSAGPARWGIYVQRLRDGRVASFDDAALQTRDPTGATKRAVSVDAPLANVSNPMAETAMGTMAIVTDSGARHLLEVNLNDGTWKSIGLPTYHRRAATGRIIGGVVGGMEPTQIPAADIELDLLAVTGRPDGRIYALMEDPSAQGAALWEYTGP